MEKEAKDKIVRILPIISYLFAVYLLARATDESILLVMLGLSPALINLVVLQLYDPNKEENHLIAFLTPLILTAIFLIVWKFAISDAVTRMEGPVVAFINVVIGYFMTLIFIKIEKKNADEEEDIEMPVRVIPVQEAPAREDTDELKAKIREYAHALKSSAATKEAETQYLRGTLADYQARLDHDDKELEKLKRELNNYTVTLDMTSKNSEISEQRIRTLKELISRYEKKAKNDGREINRLREMISDYSHALQTSRKEIHTHLRSIEDKCKAINFVIGRVYSDKKGGSADVREKLQIPRELYNNFTELLNAKTDAQNVKLNKTLSKILIKLEQLEMTEADILPLKKGRIEIMRDAEDTVLDVLAKNDKDPIFDYHSEAKAVCQNLLTAI